MREHLRERVEGSLHLRLHLFKRPESTKREYFDVASEQWDQALARLKALVER